MGEIRVEYVSEQRITYIYKKMAFSQWNVNVVHPGKKRKRKLIVTPMTEGKPSRTVKEKE